MEFNADARAAFDAMREGITVINTHGEIIFANQAYIEFLHKEVRQDIGPIEGKKLRDLRPGARLPDVLEAGKPILHLTRQEIKDFYFVNLYPIYEDGVLAGGLSVVTFLEDAYQAKEELEAMEARGEGGYRFLPLKVSKTTGAVSGEALASAERLGRLGRHIQAVLGDICREIGAGNISADPFWRGPEKNACRYCDYAAACHFEEGRGGDCRRWLPHVKPEEFWENVEQEGTR